MSMIYILKHELVRSWGFYRLYRFPSSVYAVYHGSHELASFRNIVDASIYFDGCVTSEICKNVECVENELKTGNRNRP